MIGAYLSVTLWEKLKVLTGQSLGTPLLKDCAANCTLYGG